MAYEYGYNSDGGKVWKKDHLNPQEYRYLCRIGCGGTPMRVYNRAMGATTWTTLEEYMDAPTVVWYGVGTESSSAYPWLAGHWLSDPASPDAGQMLYQDAFGLWVGGDFSWAALPSLPERVPEYLKPNPDEPHYVAAMAIPAICAIPCAGAGLCIAAGLAYIAGCLVGCRGKSDYWGCVVGCISRIPGWILTICGAALAACILCILWPIIGRGLGRIDEGLDRLCPGYKVIIPKCLREAGSDYLKLIGCILDECRKARTSPIITIIRVY